MKVIVKVVNFITFVYKKETRCRPIAKLQQLKIASPAPNMLLDDEKSFFVFLQMLLTASFGFADGLGAEAVESEPTFRHLSAAKPHTTVTMRFLMFKCIRFLMILR